jgi:plasmid stabilization system protein ParE
VPAPNYTLDSPVARELWEIWDFIAKDNVEAADRVIKATHETFGLIARNPGMGKLCRLRNPRLKNIYFRTVTNFENYLIFYRKTSPGIHVLHVLHKARNIEKIFRTR